MLLPRIKLRWPAWLVGLLTTILEQLGMNQTKITFMTSGEYLRVYNKDFLFYLP